jgi:hypothetical protein
MHTFLRTRIYPTALSHRALPVSCTAAAASAAFPYFIALVSPIACWHASTVWLMSSFVWANER